MYWLQKAGYTHNWPNFVCFHHCGFLQIVAFEIIFCCVVWYEQGAYFGERLVGVSMGNLLFMCNYTLLKFNKTTLDTETHIDSTLMIILLNWNRVVYPSVEDLWFMCSNSSSC